MGQRLTVIYTRTGDQGETSLGNGERIAKNHPRIHMLGELDELNSQLGLIAAFSETMADRDSCVDLVHSLQHRLFDIGAELSQPGKIRVLEAHVNELESELDRINDTLPPLMEFILPGGNPASAHTHVARSQCRRCERSLVDLAQTEDINPQTLAYINRLSDLLFVLARSLGRTDHHETLWQTRQ